MSIFCKQCGKQLKDDAKFCFSCGAKVGNDDLQNVNQSETVSAPTVVVSSNKGRPVQGVDINKM
jgi:uncharacterized membrane protein YvbJ